MTGVLALARQFLSLSHGTVPSGVPVGHQRDSGTNGTFGTHGTVGTSGTLRTNGTLATPDSQDEIDALEERTAIAIELGDVPAEYAKDFARVQCLRLASVSDEDQTQAANDAGIFLDRWGKAALGNGWSSGDIFGLPNECGEAGLVWQIKGDAVAGIGVDGVFRIKGRRPAQTAVVVVDGRDRHRFGSAVS
jgi:hypothetical protein